MKNISNVLPKIVPHCVDIWEHFPVLVALASECQSVVEMGVRGGCSAYALAAGLEESEAKDKWMLYLDINPCQNPKLEELCKQANIDIKFQQADSRQVDIPMCDLLFIDTLHTYGQLKIELELHQSKALKYIVLHDTEAPWGHKNEVDDGSPDRGLRPAVDEFLEANADKWNLHAHFKNCHGLTVLARA